MHLKKLSSVVSSQFASANHFAKLLATAFCDEFDCNWLAIVVKSGRGFCRQRCDMVRHPRLLDPRLLRRVDPNQSAEAVARSPDVFTSLRRRY
jgi:hypothetical protein